MKKILFSILFTFVSFCAIAQLQTPKAGSVFGFSYAGTFPQADMKFRYGYNSNVTGQYWYKNDKNFMIGGSATFLFGNILNEPALFDSISTSQGFVLNEEGRYSEIRLFERGYSVMAGVAKIFTVSKYNRNSGFFVQIDGGYLQHKIRIETIGNSTPQLSKEYRKGYDRLTSGFALHQTIGFLYLDNRSLINVFGGLDITEGFTQGRRRYQYDTQMPYLNKRLDVLVGFRVGILLPIYNSAVNKEIVY